MEFVSNIPTSFLMAFLQFLSPTARHHVFFQPNKRLVVVDNFAHLTVPTIKWNNENVMSFKVLKLFMLIFGLFSEYTSERLANTCKWTCKRINTQKNTQKSRWEFVAARLVNAKFAWKLCGYWLRILHYCFYNKAKVLFQLNLGACAVTITSRSYYHNIGWLMTLNDNSSEDWYDSSGRIFLLIG